MTALKIKCRVNVRKSILWRENFKDLLFYEKQIYISEEKLLRAELLKYYYNNILAEYFRVERTFKLINYKYYWSDMNKDMKNYIFLYNIC